MQGPDMNDSILFVDDNRLILESSRDLFLAQGVAILTANNVMEALEIFSRHDIAVVVSDNYMPEISGLEFLSQLKVISPDTVKILISDCR